MKKSIKIIFIVVVTVIILALGYTFLKLAVFDLGSVDLTDIQVKDSSVSFTYVNSNSGCFVKSYKYSIDDDGNLTIRFQGTMFRFLALETSSGNITFKEAVNIKKINLQSYDGSEKTVWDAD